MLRKSIKYKRQTNLHKTKTKASTKSEFKFTNVKKELREFIKQCYMLLGFSVLLL